MFPKSASGWIVLIVVGAVVIWGFAGAGTNLGHALQGVLTGIRNFGSALRG